MKKTFYLPLGILIVLLVYTIYSQNVKVKDFREYESKVIIYSKDKCKYCVDAKNFFIFKDTPYIDIDITWDKELHQKLSQETGQTTVPYIFINGKFIGGYQQLIDLEKNKKIEAMLR